MYSNIDIEDQDERLTVAVPTRLKKEYLKLNPTHKAILKDKIWSALESVIRESKFITGMYVKKPDL